MGRARKCGLLAWYVDLCAMPTPTLPAGPSPLPVLANALHQCHAYLCSCPFRLGLGLPCPLLHAHAPHRSCQTPSQAAAAAAAAGCGRGQDPALPCDPSQPKHVQAHCLASAATAQTRGMQPGTALRRRSRRPGWPTGLPPGGEGGGGSGVILVWCGVGKQWYGFEGGLPPRVHSGAGERQEAQVATARRGPRAPQQLPSTAASPPPAEHAACAGPGAIPWWPTPPPPSLTPTHPPG